MIKNIKKLILGYIEFCENTADDGLGWLLLFLYHLGAFTIFIVILSIIVLTNGILLLPLIAFILFWLNKDKIKEWLSKE